MTKTKAQDSFHGHVLSTVDCQARDDSRMGRMFGIAKLQLRIGGRPKKDTEINTMVERYPLKDYAMYICRMGPTFQEPLDYDEATIDYEDEEVDDDATSLMAVDGPSDVADENIVDDDDEA